MAYFLGRDVDVYITTESSDGTNANGVWVIWNGPVASVTGVSGAAYLDFARSRDNSANLFTNGGGYPVLDVTGVDVSIGAVDEDVTYFGIRSVTKAEIKKETTISLTCKKSNLAWDAVFDGARYGTNGANPASFTANALRSPTVNTGYRLHVVMKTSEEVFSIPGMCIQGHTVSVNADGTSEETMEFMSYIAPRIGNVANTTVLATTDL